MNLKINVLIFCITLSSIWVKAQEKHIPTFKEYIKQEVPSKQEIDIFLKKQGVWSKFDSQLGYILGNSFPLEGIDTSFNISTTDAIGARKMLVYKDKVCRINTYGDSFTQCQQVSDGETWQEYLAAHLGEPVRNFGVGGYGTYQAYLRLLREEKTDHAAKYLIFYIWGDDHIRSLLRCRYLAIKDWNVKNEIGMKFHGNFWSNLEMDLNTGKFIEKENPLNTPALLYKMTDKDWMYQNLKDDIALQLLLYKIKKISKINFNHAEKLAKALKLNINFKDSVNMEKNMSYLLDKYSFAATEYILKKLKIYAEQNDKKLMIVLFDPYRVTNSLMG